MRIVVLAVPGGGKTTIMRYVQKDMPDVKVVNFGDYMFKMARRLYGIKDRDEMRKKIPPDDYVRLQEEAAREIASIPGDVLIDTHVSIKMRGGYYPGLPDDVVKLLKPHYLVLFEFNPEVVLSRRMKDIRGIRSGRDIEKPEEVEMQQQINRLFAAAAANAARAILRIVDLRFPESHPYEHAEVGAREIIKLLKTS
ncbi:adenylate kinase [Candidatus Bathyarchaeota archaeon]|nr:MAG: adenylate kinase [Candidatus Bathyarchaeota archaeon]